MHAIDRSCAIKADIVALDEREGGVRATLNLGHTFGHAIEAAQGYGEPLPNLFILPVSFCQKLVSSTRHPYPSLQPGQCATSGQSAMA